MTTNSTSMTRRQILNVGTGMAGAALVTTLGFNRLAQAAETDEPITQIAKFQLNMDKEKEAVAALEELCAAVEEKEPGVLAYICHRSAKKPEELLFFEIYKDADAMKAHGGTPHLGKLRAVFASLFKGPLEVVRLDRVGGFSR